MSNGNVVGITDGQPLNPAELPVPPTFMAEIALPAGITALIHGQAEEIKTLRAKLGETALALEAAEQYIIELDTYIDTQQQTAQTAIAEIELPASQPHQIGSVIAKQTVVHEEPTVLSSTSAHEPSTMLSEPQQRFEATVLALLRKPGFSIEDSNASGVLKNEAHITGANPWTGTRARLTELGILEFEKSSPRAKRFSKVSLNIAKLLQADGQPFVTQRVKGELQKALTKSPTDVESQEQNHEAKLVPVETTEPTMPLATQPEKPGYTIPAGRLKRYQHEEGQQGPTTGGRVRKQKEIKPFLTHSQARPGAKQRH